VWIVNQIDWIVQDESGLDVRGMSADECDSPRHSMQHVVANIDRLELSVSVVSQRIAWAKTKGAEVGIRDLPVDDRDDLPDVVVRDHAIASRDRTARVREVL